MKDRATGRTTRLVDEAIQDLFQTGECHVWDHYEDGKNTFANTQLANVVRARLIMEHRIDARNIQFIRNKLGVIIRIRNEKLWQ